MKTIGLVAVVLYSLVCSSAQSNTPKLVARGNTVSVTMRFKSAIQTGNALPQWQTSDGAAVKYADQRGVALAFRCSGEFTRNNDVLTIALQDSIRCCGWKLLPGVGVPRR